MQDICEHECGGDRRNNQNTPCRDACDAAERRPFSLGIEYTLDGLLGEPRRAHPLVGFGRCAKAIERVFNSQRKWPTFCRIAGIAAWCILIIAPVAAAFVLTDVLPGSFAYPVHCVL